MPVLLEKLSLARSIGLPSFMRYLLRHAIPPDSTIIRTDAVFEESARRVEVLILSKHGTCQSCRQRGSQVSKRMLSDVILLSTVRVRLRQLVRADKSGDGPERFGAAPDRRRWERPLHNRNPFVRHMRRGSWAKKS
jgi:hypothetical protein